MLFSCPSLDLINRTVVDSARATSCPSGVTGLLAPTLKPAAFVCNIHLVCGFMVGLLSDSPGKPPISIRSFKQEPNLNVAKIFESARAGFAGPHLAL